jgi:hypothetical protein
MNHRTIKINKDTSLDSVLQQLRGTKLPCILNIYDRAFPIETKDELHSFMFGLEVGNYIALDKRDNLKLDLRDEKLDPQAG